MTIIRSPLHVTDDGEVPFQKPVSGVTPTASAHLVTKAYADALSGGGTTDHGALTGLGDDDHTQYIPVDASRQPTSPLGSTAAPTIPQHYQRGTELTASQAAQDAATAAFLSAFYMPLGGAATSLAMATARMLGRTAGGSGAVQEMGASDVRTFLGLGALALLAQITLTTHVTGTLPIANGGTGATSASASRAALGASEEGHEHEGTEVAIDISSFTGSLDGADVTNVQKLAAWIDANLTP